MTEIEKIEYARGFIEKLSRGINPIDEREIPDGEVAKNERLSRCFAYVSYILSQIVEREKRKETRRERPVREKFFITSQQMLDFPYSEEPITLGEFC